MRRFCKELNSIFFRFSEIHIKSYMKKYQAVFFSNPKGGPQLTKAYGHYMFIHIVYQYTWDVLKIGMLCINILVSARV